VLFVPATAAEEAEDTKKSDARVAPAKMPFFVSAQIEGRHDSDSDSDPGSVDELGLINLQLSAEVGWRWTKNNWTLDAAGGFDGWKTDWGESDSELQNHEFYGRFDAELPQNAARAIHMERLTVGTQYGFWRSRVGGQSAAESNNLTVGVQGMWNTTNSGCTLDNVLLFYERSDFDEESVAVPALSRDGDHTSLGIEANFYRYGDYTMAGCRRTGILRRYVPSGATSLAVGFRVNDVDAVGEFASDSQELYFDGRFPIQWSGDGEPLASLDLSLGVSRIDYDNPSLFFPFVAREDTPSYFEAAWVRHLKRFDFRAGYRTQTNASSDVLQYQYERDYVFFNLVFERFRDRGTGTGDTGSGGSSSGSRGGQSGSSGPIIPEPNP